MPYIIIALILSHAAAFIAGLLVFRNNAARLAAAEQAAKDKAAKVREALD